MPESTEVKDARVWIQRLEDDEHWARTPAIREEIRNQLRILRALVDGGATTMPERCEFRVEGFGRCVQMAGHGGVGHLVGDEKEPEGMPVTVCVFCQTPIVRVDIPRDIWEHTASKYLATQHTARPLERPKEYEYAVKLSDGSYLPIGKDDRSQAAPYTVWRRPKSPPWEQDPSTNPETK